MIRIGTNHWDHREQNDFMIQYVNPNKPLKPSEKDQHWQKIIIFILDLASLKYPRYKSRRNIMDILPLVLI